MSACWPMCGPCRDRDAIPTSLAKELPAEGIDYVHVPALGGFRRRAAALSVNAGWRNESFRAFADYMQGEEFAAGIESLLERARAQRTAVMCSEAVPWRCHRSLIADALVVRGVRVTHLLGAGRGQPHALTPFARVVGTSITYPAAS